MTWRGSGLAVWGAYDAVGLGGGGFKISKQGLRDPKAPRALDRALVIQR